MAPPCGTWPFRILFSSFKPSLPSYFAAILQALDRPLRGRFRNEGGGFGFRIAAGSPALPNSALLPGPSRAGDKLPPADKAAAGFTDPWLLFPGPLLG